VQRTYDVERRLGLRSNRYVALYDRISNDSLSIDYKSSWQGKRPRIVAIENGQIEAHTAVVVSLLVGKRESNPKRVGDLIARIAQ